LPALLVLAGTYLAAGSIGSCALASVAAAGHGRGSASAFYFGHAVLAAFGATAGEGLVGEVGVARGTGIMHLLMEALLGCAERGCGTFDPVRI
jgi:hypothetical protein